MNSAKRKARPYDLIVFGATGFTGRLVAQYLLQAYGAGGKYVDEAPTWAMAGRSVAKLESVRDLIGAPKDLPLITVDAQDAEALTAMAMRAKVIVTTVGPYQLHGEPLLRACESQAPTMWTCAASRIGWPT